MRTTFSVEFSPFPFEIRGFICYLYLNNKTASKASIKTCHSTICLTSGALPHNGWSSVTAFTSQMLNVLGLAKNCQQHSSTAASPFPSLLPTLPLEMFSRIAPATKRSVHQAFRPIVQVDTLAPTISTKTRVYLPWYSFLFNLHSGSLCIHQACCRWGAFQKKKTTLQEYAF